MIINACQQCFAHVSLNPLNLNKKDLSFSEKSLVVEQVENCLHPITEELKRWQYIVGEHYIDHKLEEQRNGLATIP
jgi:hypothetical protein